ncbi:MAG: glycosyltransferase family 4 protein [Phycisphaerales bacterium]|nr:glycosyltransferase family 4 protein [Phycisphaerales bacterium]
MKIVMLAAGAAGMVCGSCLRDNRLAAALIAQGRNVLLMPLYTPLRTDEADVSVGDVQLGGISVYLRHKLPFLRHMPAWFARALSGHRLLSSVARFGSATRAEDLGALTVSVLKGKNGPQRAELHRLITALKPERPEILNLPNLMLLGAAGPLREALGARIVCTLGGEDIFLDALPEPHRSESFRLIAQAAEHVDAFIAVTRYYADHASRHFDLPARRVRTVPLGVNVERFQPADGPPPPPMTIGYLARICPAKGLHLLVDAFVALRRGGTHARLRVAGYTASADAGYLRESRDRIQAAGLGGDVDWVGEVDLPGKVEFLRSLHVFCVPTVYPESKGLSILESMACSVPVVQPAHGSFPELAGETGAGLLFPPGDLHALTDALAQLLGDPERRRGLGEEGRAAARARFTAERMAAETWRVYEEVLAGGEGARG